MARLSTVKKRLDALSKSIEELESTLKETPAVVESAPVDIREELKRLDLDQLKEIYFYITDLLVNQASNPSREKKGSRMLLAEKQKMVNKYLDEGDASEGDKEWYRQIEAKRGKERNVEEQKMFVEFRRRAQKWFEKKYPQE